MSDEKRKHEKNVRRIYMGRRREKVEEEEEGRRRGGNRSIMQLYQSM
jgi:hypothetical protein